MFSSKTARSPRISSGSGLQILIARKPEALKPAKLERMTGKDQYDHWVAVAYLSEDGVPGRNFNKMLVDAGHAEIKDFENNEFDPWSWWRQPF